MRRTIIAAALILLLFTSCATARRPQALAFTIDHIDEDGSLALSLSHDTLLAGGYRHGDWVSLEVGGVIVDALVAESAHTLYPTLVATQTGLHLHMPQAIQAGAAGLVRPSSYTGKQHNSSVSLSGSFVFTF